MLRHSETVPSVCPYKKGAGRIAIHPARTPILLFSGGLLQFRYHFPLSRQNLAALSAATGKNLAAVGSSHSLPETMNLGTMATAGLVGTFHLRYTSLKSHKLDNLTVAATHSL